MKEELSEMEQLRAFATGVQAAFIAVLGAIIRTYPDPVALEKMLQSYYQREQAYLENKAVPELVLDTFQQLWKRVEIEIQHTLEHGQQLPPTQE